MRAAERALGANSAHAPRLKGATVRSVRRFLGSAFPRGSCAFQAHVLFADAAPSGVAAWGYFCSAFHAGTHVWGRRHSCRFSESARRNFSLSFKLSSPVSARFREDFRAFPWSIRTKNGRTRPGKFRHPCPSVFIRGFLPLSSGSGNRGSRGARLPIPCRDAARSSGRRSPCP